MYPISELHRLPLRDRGLEIPVEQLFNADQVSLVNGICRVNGCTGSFVSPNGLIITNHHCAFDAIQNASTAENDLLNDGFVADGLEQEIPARGYTVRITEAYEDVSAQVLSAVTDQQDSLERNKAIDKRCKELERNAEQEHPGLRAEVAEMFAGKTYVLFLYTYLKDVRLVFAPPASIGAFGGEVDNWEWPRHTGDFSFLRAYVAPDGSSAEYAATNVPYRPKRFIQVAPAGVSENDFVFLLGYPGRTVRHKSASYLKYERDVRLPSIVDLYAWQIAEMEQISSGDRALAIKLATRIKGLANVEKRSRGQLQGMQRAKIVEARAEQEKAMQQFIQQSDELRDKYGTVLEQIDEINALISQKAPLESNLSQLRSACRSLSFGFLLYDAAVEREKPDLERESAYMDRNFDQTVQRLLLDVADWHGPLDEIMLAGMLSRLSKIPQAASIEPLSDLVGDPATIAAKARSLIAGTKLGDPEYVRACLEETAEQLRDCDDPMLKLAVALYPTFLEMREESKAINGRLDPLYADLVDVRQKFLATQFVPDANGTLRLTFGAVRGYSPADAVYKTPIATLKGVIDKTTGVEPFITPPEVIEHFLQGKFAGFEDAKLGQVPVAILYDTDTTGGNSGSPVLNARGQLVGVNFDRTFEATINDFAWNESYSRSIGVDIRYVLWLTGTVYGAQRLLDEMGVAAH
jgi:hypothetical protein